MRALALAMGLLLFPAAGWADDTADCLKTCDDIVKGCVESCAKNSKGKANAAACKAPCTQVADSCKKDCKGGPPAPPPQDGTK